MFVVTAKEMYDIDHCTMEKIGLEGKILMENAGRAAAEKLKPMIQINDRIMVVIGPGNNGGDGFVIARTLMESAYNVKVVQAVPDEKITGDARYHKDVWLNFGGEVEFVLSQTELESVLRETDVVIDALLGIGVKGDLRKPLNGMVKVINEAEAKVFSIDIPSGLPAGEGIKEFTAVKADVTFVIGAPKLSAFLQHTAPFYGERHVVSIGFPPFVMRKFTNRKHWRKRDVKASLPERKVFSHKGNHGRGLVVGGSAMMPGAITMTSKAALKSGAGLITAATVKSAFPAIHAHCPEVMCLPLAEEDGYITNESTVPLNDFDAVAIGIGMGRKEETGEVIAGVLKSTDGPLIIDADGLFHVKSHLSLLKERTSPTVITPHPKEMAVLLDITVQELLQQPFYYAAHFAKTYGVYVILKGKYTIISAPSGEQAVNDTGNQGLAKGGSGDVLTGIVLAMILQNQSIFEALCNACYIHGKAADVQTENKHTYYDLMATDVIEGIPDVYQLLLER
ncbi:NAD(P)H-hydrate dehydratase [Virgibacillus kimchii]